MHYKIYIFIFLIFTLLVSCSSTVNKSYEKEISIAEKKEILVQKKILINEMAKASIRIHKISWPILLSNREKCKNNKKNLTVAFLLMLMIYQKKIKNIFKSF